MNVIIFELEIFFEIFKIVFVVFLGLVKFNRCVYVFLEYNLFVIICFLIIEYFYFCFFDGVYSVNFIGVKVCIEYINVFFDLKKEF